MLRETLKQEINQLSESQLREMADFLASIKAQSQQSAKTDLFWQHATPTERSQNFRAWVTQLPKTGSSLPDTAFDRSSIYE